MSVRDWRRLGIWTLLVLCVALCAQDVVAGKYRAAAVECAFAVGWAVLFFVPDRRR